jgi:hypothetical protein
VSKAGGETSRGLGAARVVLALLLLLFLLLFVTTTCFVWNASEADHVEPVCVDLTGCRGFGSIGTLGDE